MCSQEGRSYLVHAERVAAGAVHPDVVPVPGRRTVHQKVLGSRWPARGELLAYLFFPLVNVHGKRQRMHMKHRQTTCGCTRNPSPSSTGSCTTHSSDAQGVHCQHSRSVYLVLYLTMYSWSGSNRATPALPAPKHGSIRQNPQHMDPSGNTRAHCQHPNMDPLGKPHTTWIHQATHAHNLTGGIQVQLGQKLTDPRPQAIAPSDGWMTCCMRSGLCTRAPACGSAKTRPRTACPGCTQPCGPCTAGCPCRGSNFRSCILGCNPAGSQMHLFFRWGTVPGSLCLRKRGTRNSQGS